MKLKNIKIKDSNGNLLAEDTGQLNLVSLELLKEKMLKKGIVFNEEFHVVEELEIVDPNSLKEIYDAMVDDIYAEMLNVFGTKNDVSAQAFAATWEAMISRPANYVDLELGFTDEAAVTTYAQAKLQVADQYATFRLKRIAQYEAEKAALQNA